MKNLINIIIAFTLITLSNAYADDTKIYVRGSANVKAPADIGLINFSVQTTNKDASKAQAENSKIVNNVLKELKSKFKIEDKFIQTSGINVGPKYNYPRDGGERQFQGFEVNNSLTVKVIVLNEMGNILDALIKQGVNNINSISFDIENKQPLILKALEQAYDDAKEKAEVLARKAGKKLSKLEHVNEYYSQGMSPMPRLGGIAKMSAAMDSMPIQSGEEAVSASVELIYETK